MRTDDVLRTHDLSKSHRSGHRVTHAVRGVDLSVRRGEWLAVTGPSGGGKSTLLHLLGGLDVPDAGEVVVDGQSLSRLSEARRAVLRRRHIGYVFQSSNLIGDLTVAENVELPMLLVGTRARPARRRTRALLEALGVEELLGAATSELSGGQQQRVALARALANDPTVLLADEPTGALDSSSTAEVLALLAAQHATGQTIVVVTHDPRVAARADRMVTMRDGCLDDAAHPGRSANPLPLAAAVAEAVR
jgi:putative ABC transport system ATP-binding protein